jgi:clan AA aspartic protease (TIGR02281 family)
MLSAVKEEDAAERQVAAKDKLIVDYIQKRRQLRAQLQNAKSAAAYNRIVDVIQELGDRVTLMHNDKQLDEQVKQIRAAASTAREAYVQALLDMRELVRAVEEKYADLAVDKDVQAALALINSEGDKTYALGPATSFKRNVTQLKKLEDGILSESIDLRRQGDLFSVAVMFNGKYSKELAVDTGASVVSLPLATAKEVGVEPTEDDPVIQLRLADGRVVEARLVTIDELRVGKFVVEKVECAVMGEDLPEAAPLLGQSFLRHFTYKLDPQSAKLIMTKVEPSSRR